MGDVESQNESAGSDGDEEQEVLLLTLPSPALSDNSTKDKNNKENKNNRKKNKKRKRSFDKKESVTKEPELKKRKSSEKNSLNDTITNHTSITNIKKKKKKKRKKKKISPNNHEFIKAGDTATIINGSASMGVVLDSPSKLIHKKR